MTETMTTKTYLHGHKDRPDDLEAYARENATHLALLDEDDEEVTRLSLSADDRVSYREDAINPLDVVVTVEGSNPDIPAPITLAGAEFFGAAASTVILLAASFTPAPLEPDEEFTLRLDRVDNMC